MHAIFFLRFLCFIVWDSYTQELLQQKDAQLVAALQLNRRSVQVHTNSYNTGKLRNQSPMDDPLIGTIATFFFLLISMGQRLVYCYSSMCAACDTMFCVLCCNVHVLNMQTPLQELKLPLQLEWRRVKDMPLVMGSYPQAVIVKGKVYIGGAGTVVVYDPQCDQWTSLRPYGCESFGMAVVNNQLVVVGGIDIQTDKKTNKLGVWNELFGRWAHPFPSMHTARQSPEVVTHDNRWMVVVGDFDNRTTVTEISKVEILDISSYNGRWHIAIGAPITQSLYKLTSAVIGNVFILFGGAIRRGAAMQVCLDDLISYATVPQPAGMSTLPIPSPWQTLPKAPLEGSSALVINGALLAIGGVGSKDIHLYQPSSRSWVKAGELPTERSACVCIVLPSGELLVTGGEVNERRVDIACVQY